MSFGVFAFMQGSIMKLFFSHLSFRIKLFVEISWSTKSLLFGGRLRGSVEVLINYVDLFVS